MADQTTGWQPIATVPRDGTLVDLWVRSYFWTADGQKQLAVEFRAPDAAWHAGQWCNEDGNQHDYLADFPSAEIEFWRPRPEPPEAATDV